MADEPIPENIEAQVDKAVGVTKRRKKRKPSYKAVGDSKIPVSAHQGKVWRARMQSGIKKVDEVSDAWDEAIRYYSNDQSPHREGGGTQTHKVGNTLGNQRLNNNITETENVVFANVTTMVPALYARNPAAEFTATNDRYKELAVTLEHLVNTLFQLKTSP